MDQPAHFQNQDSLIIEDDEITKTDTVSDSSTEAAVPSYWQSAIFTKNDQFMVNRIDEGTSDYENVKRSFVNGMRNFDKHIDVVGIHRRNYKSSVIDEARVEAFRVFSAAVASRNGGDPNIKFGWYGGSREEIREILCHGFCSFENRSSSHGHGVYFSPVNNPIASARLSIADVDGTMHVLLCRLILGKPEPIPFGSQTDLPTSTEFHSGVDDISSPTRYIIWEPYMNTTILPIFIVTFKRESLEIGAESFSISKSMWVNLMNTHLPNYLSSSKMALIKKQHDEFVQNKISRVTFVRNLRLIAGDDVLRVVIQHHVM